MDYINNCPPPSPATLMVVGLAGKATEPTSELSPQNLRHFELKSSVYEGKDSNIEFSVECFFRHGNRFRNTPYLRHQALVLIYGEIIGTYIASGCLALLIDDSVFLSIRSSTADIKDDDHSSGSLSGIESSKRKWDGWGSHGGSFMVL